MIEFASERRKKRLELEARGESLQQAVQCVQEQPTAAWVTEQMQALHDVLRSTPAAAHALRALVGGSIVVEAAKSGGRKRRHLSISLMSTHWTPRPNR